MSDLGRILIIAKGEYNNSTTYEMLDVVSYQRSSYMLKVPSSKGVLPINTNNWQLMSAHGDDGIIGNRWFTGTAISGKESIPKSYNTGISDANVNDLYLNTKEGAVYHCTLGGPDSVAKWVFDFTMSGGGSGGGATIMDDVISTDYVWSSNKTNSELEKIYDSGFASRNLFDEKYPNISSDITYRAIPVNGVVTMSTSAPQNTGYGANLFLLSGNVSSGASTGGNGVYIGNNRTVEPTDGYITIAYRNSEGVDPRDYNTQIEYGSSATAYTPYSESNVELTKMLHKYTELGFLADDLLGDLVVGALSFDTGAEVDGSGNRVRSGFISISDKPLNLYAKVSNVQARVLFYRSDKTFISAQSSWNNVTEDGFAISGITNSAYIRIVFRLSTDSTITVDSLGDLILSESKRGGGTSDYESLSNLPQVNGHELVGNQNSSQLGLMPNPTGEWKTGHTVRWDGTEWKSAYQQGSETVFNNNTAKFNPAVDNVQSAIEATKALIDSVQSALGDKADASELDVTVATSSVTNSGTVSFTVTDTSAAYELYVNVGSPSDSFTPVTIKSIKIENNSITYTLNNAGNGAQCKLKKIHL